MKEVGDDHTALLDFDQPAPPPLRDLWSVCRIIGAAPVAIRTDRTAHGWHVAVTFADPLTPTEICAFQAICRSDWKREALNLMRLIAIRRLGIRAPWRHRWNLLYAYKLEI